MNLGRNITDTLKADLPQAPHHPHQHSPPVDGGTTHTHSPGPSEEGTVLERVLGAGEQGHWVRGALLTQLPQGQRQAVLKVFPGTKEMGLALLSCPSTRVTQRGSCSPGDQDGPGSTQQKDRVLGTGAALGERLTWDGG